MAKSIDKCSGEGCICHELRKPVRVLTNVKIHSISIDSGPSIFPGAGGMAIQMVIPDGMTGTDRDRQIVRNRMDRARQAEHYGGQ